MSQHRLSAFGAGNDWGSGAIPDDRDESFGHESQCTALTADGEQCKNARSRMTDSPFCSSHDRMEDPDTVGEEVRDG